jgi:hypothetical protein
MKIEFYNYFLNWLAEMYEIPREVVEPVTKTKWNICEHIFFFLLSGTSPKMLQFCNWDVASRVPSLDLINYMPYGVMTIRGRYTEME